MEKRFPLRSVLAVTVTSIALLLSFSYAHTAYAQVASVTGSATGMTVSNPRSLTGITTSCIQEVAEVQSRSTGSALVNGVGRAIGGIFGNYNCGDAPTSSGSFLLDPAHTKPVTWVSGDVIRGTDDGDSNEMVVVTHSDGSYTVYEGSGFTVAETVTNYDKNGTQVGEQYQQSTAGAAATGLTSAVAGATSTAANAVRDASECTQSSLGDCILRSVASVILTFANFLLGLAGAALNYVVYYCVFKFGSLIGNSPGVLIAWGILRDIANMMLLFGFIFLGVATILNTDKFPTKKAIPRLLIFAILMNFSLFACEAVIDLANGTSSLLYTQADPVSTQCIGLAGSSSSTGSNCDFLNYGVAGHIMQSTGLSSIWQNPANTSASPTALLGLAVFATIGFIVCLAAAIMLLIRLIILTFLMVVSPIGFAGMAIPFFQKFSNDWWNRVIHQAFFAPIMFLLIFISLKIADSFTSGPNAGINGGLAGGLGTLVTNPNVSTMGIVLVFMLTCGFLLASVIVAHRFGAMGASGAIGFSKKIILGGYSAAGRTAGGVVGRNTVGRVSNKAQSFYQKQIGKNATMRNLLAGSALDSAIMNTTNKGKNAKFGSSSSLADKEKKTKERKEELEKAGRKANLQSDLDAALANKAGLSDDAKNDKISEVLERMSTKELEELDVLKKSGDKLDALVKNLSPEKFAAVVKDGGAMSEEQKKAIKESRFKDIRDQQKIINDPNATIAAKAAAQQAIKDRMKKFSNKDLENGPADLFTDDLIAQGLSNSQRDDLIKGGKLSAGAARNVKKFDPVEQVNAAFANSGGLAAARLIRTNRLNPKQVARLKSDVLQSADVARVLTPKMLAAIQERNEIDDQTARTIKMMVTQYGTGPAQTYMTTNPAGMAYWS